MHRTRSLSIAAGVVTLAMVAVACGSGGAYGGGETTTSSVGSTEAAAIEAADSGLGSVLVDAGGFTLYLFEQDTGTTSTCTGDCATTWPPLTTDGNATAGNGAQSSRLGTTSRDDGSTQVTYDGHPLYRYSGDTAAGDTNGQGVNGVWFAMTPAGTAAQGTASPSSGGYRY
jgi:predicted lipoprotein with Yx(FWY)xxD motif